jgi:hypothetical protein
VHEGLVDRDDHRVPQPRGELALAAEALDPLRLGAPGEQLQGHDPPGRVPRAVHDAHAAAAELRLDLVLPDPRAHGGECTPLDPGSVHDPGVER